MATQGDGELGLNKTELHVMVSCVRALKDFFERRSPEDKESQQAVDSIIKKLVPAYLESGKDPYDKYVTFSEDEQEVIDIALHMTMTDAPMAREYGPARDFDISPDVRLSQLADYVPVMADLLRR